MSSLARDVRLVISQAGRAGRGLPMVMAVSCLSPVSTHILMLAFLSRAILSGTLYRRWSGRCSQRHCRPTTLMVTHLLQFVLNGCSSQEMEILQVRGRDGGVRGRDGGVRGRDGGVRGRDGGVRGRDGGVRGRDGGVRGRDGGVRGRDGGVRGRDGGVRGRDGGVRGRDDRVRGRDGGVRGRDGGVRGRDGGVRGRDGGVRVWNRGSDRLSADLLNLLSCQV